MDGQDLFCHGLLSPFSTQRVSLPIPLFLPTTFTLSPAVPRSLSLSLLPFSVKYTNTGTELLALPMLVFIAP